MSSHISEAEISLWREYKIAVTENNEDAQTVLNKMTETHKRSLKELNQIIWKVEQDSGPFWMRENRISSNDWAIMQEYL